MKRFIIFIVLCLSVSCSFYENDRELFINDEESLIDDYSVGYNVIKQFISQTKSANVTSVIPFSRDLDTLLYVLNTEDGWLIISNDQRATPILASCEGEPLDYNSTKHEGIKVWLQAAADYIIKIKNSPMDDEMRANMAFWSSFPEIAIRNIKHRFETKDAFDSLSGNTYRWKLVDNVVQTGSATSNYIPHLITTKWGQGYPWNNELPYLYYYQYYGKCPTGCVAVSIAQILYYWHHTFGYPNSLYHTVYVNGTQPWIEGVQSNLVINTSDYYSSSNRWEDMPLTSYGDHVDYVGDLMMYIGKNSYMFYTPIGSGTSTAFFSFESIGMEMTQSSYDYTVVSNSLSNLKPVIIQATPYYSGDGHAWIIDGKLTRTNYYQFSQTWYELLDDETVGVAPSGVHYYTDEEAHHIDPYVYDGKTINISNSSSATNYLLMNWGYDGEFDNGEYSSSVCWHPANPGNQNNGQPTYVSNATIFYNFTAQR